jgi:hypothetical protein
LLTSCCASRAPGVKPLLTEHTAVNSRLKEHDATVPLEGRPDTRSCSGQGGCRI